VHVNGASAAHTGHDPFIGFQPFHRFLGNTTVDRDVIKPFPALLVDALQEQVRVHLVQGLVAEHHFGGQGVDGDRSHHHRRLFQKKPAKLGQVSPGGQIHDRVRPGIQGCFEFRGFQLQAAAFATSPQVGVYLGFQSLSNGPQGGEGMVAIFGQNRSACSNQVA